MVKTVIGQNQPPETIISRSAGVLNFAQESFPHRTDLKSLLADVKAALALKSLAELKPGSRETLDYANDAKLGINVTDERAVVLNYSDKNAAVTYLLIPTSKDLKDDAYSVHRQLSILDGDRTSIPTLEALLSAFGTHVERGSAKKITIQFDDSPTFTVDFAKKH